MDPEFIARRWYVNDYDFGTKYLRRVVVRWLNLGRAAAAAPLGTSPARRYRRPCSGSARAAACWTGTAARTGPRSTGPGAGYRKAPQEHTRTIALTRTLTTQGAVIRLPQSVTVGDQFAVPSLAAALLLGLHEQIGGSPDHIDVVQIAEPLPGDSGTSSDALLLHDSSPAAPATWPS